jgi:hypothetical protein
MQTQWYLCEIDNYPKHEGERLKPTDNLCVKHPDIFNSSWSVWLPIIPRVGDTLQFSGWQVQVSKIRLKTDWNSKTGIKEGLFVSAWISIRDDIVPTLIDADFAIKTINNKAIHKWESFARRGNDLQYYAWELRHKSYIKKSEDATEESSYYRWHTRIRPVAGDIIAVGKDRWLVKSVELASANVSLDGWLDLEALT